MKLEGAERLVLKALLDLQGASTEYVDDARVAAVTKMFVQDVRDWLETLEGKEFVERALRTEGLSAYVTAKGKQALRLVEPLPHPNPVVDVSPAAPSDTFVSPLPLPAAGAPRTTAPVGLFYSYSHEDESLRDELAKHLTVMKRNGVISEWHDRRIGAGEEWKGTIDKNLEEAQVILLLVSSSFLASDYCWDVETKRAIERHDRSEASIIPVILRDCDWHGAPFAKLQVLPKNAKPVTSWANRDEAWKDVAVGLRRAVEELAAVNPH
jgi:hypothetical protein